MRCKLDIWSLLSENCTKNPSQGSLELGPKALLPLGIYLNNRQSAGTAPELPIIILLCSLLGCDVCAISNNSLAASVQSCASSETSCGKQETQLGNNHQAVHSNAASFVHQTCTIASLISPSMFKSSPLKSYCMLSCLSFPKPESFGPLCGFICFTQFSPFPHHNSTFLISLETHLFASTKTVLKCLPL
jgi:hypothetical protein